MGVNAVTVVLYIYMFFRLIINDSIQSGTQIPYIKHAQEEGYGVLVMNTNSNYQTNKSTGTRSRIRVSSLSGAT